jgi:predicted nucleic acid-binding protein
MPSPFLLDTNILVHLIRRDVLGANINLLYAPLLTDPRPAISTVTGGELRSLAYQWNWGEERKEQMRFLLGYFDRVPVDALEIQEAYAVLDAYSESMGRTMGKNDVWIAASAHVTGRSLLTTDRDFDHLHPLFLHRDYIAPE